MAITKQDCLLLLTELQDQNIDVTEYFSKALMSEDIDISVIKFINDNRQLDLRSFYEKLRKSYNDKKSKLYINIVREENQEPEELIITLSSLLLQILLFSKHLENKSMFLEHARYSEILKCLQIYGETYNIIPAIKLLQLIKADLKILEGIAQK